MKLRRIFNGPKVNRVVKYFVFADLLFFAGWGFVAPIFSIFVIEEIEGATLVAVGISASIYWVTRSLVQPFIANKIDKKEGEKDDLYILMLGLALTGVTAFMFVLARTLTHLYILQAIHGVALGMYSTPWSTVFSRHLDKKRQAFDWSLDKASIGIAVAITSFVGSWLASAFGFDTTFIIAGALSLVSAFVVFLVPDLVLPSPKKAAEEVDLQRHQPSTTH